LYGFQELISRFRSGKGGNPIYHAGFERSTQIDSMDKFLET